MKTQKTIRVLVTSIDAGGGHKELKHNLIRTIGGAEGITLIDYHSETKVFDTLYKFMVKHIPLAWKIMNDYGKVPVILKTAKPFLKFPEQKKFEEAIRKYKPDLILSCYFNQTIIALDIRKKLNAKFIVVNCLPDYGDQSSELHHTTPADYYLVRDDYTKNFTVTRVPSEIVLTYGTTVNPIFKEIKALTDKALNTEFEDFITDNIIHPSYNPQKPSVLVVGGSGWTFKSIKLIKKLAKTDKYNVFVCCGRDKDLFEKLNDRKNINPFGFVDQRSLAIVERAVDVAVLSSIAPATLHELMETNKYPIFVHRYINGQESHHIDLIKHWGVGLYEPADQGMMNIIDDFIQNRHEYQPMIDKAAKIRKIEEEKSNHNAELIRNIAHLRDKSSM